MRIRFAIEISIFRASIGVCQEPVSRSEKETRTQSTIPMGLRVPSVTQCVTVEGFSQAITGIRGRRFQM
jgi:hypothetical protein